jgi:hypothetical protein
VTKKPEEMLKQYGITPPRKVKNRGSEVPITQEQQNSNQQGGVSQNHHPWGYQERIDKKGPKLPTVL